MTAFYERYPTQTKNLAIGGQPFKFLVPKSIDSFIHQEDLLTDFPLWSKIWEASMILADHLAAMPPDPQKRILEIGGGVGLVGIVAACFGHRVTIMEQNPDAVRFARANAEVNRCSNGEGPLVTQVDWRQPALKRAFDYIVGSEVIYNEKVYTPLRRLFTTCLVPGGTVILAERAKKTSIAFFQQMSSVFEITARKKVLRLEGEEVRVILAGMIPRA
ncbi:MAG: class I SAM-dependent methyltransferase [Desulfobacteraceae bacterium]